MAKSGAQTAAPVSVFTVDRHPLVTRIPPPHLNGILQSFNVGSAQLRRDGPNLGHPVTIFFRVRAELLIDNLRGTTPEKVRHLILGRHLHAGHGHGTMPIEKTCLDAFANGHRDLARLAGAITDMPGSVAHHHQGREAQVLAALHHFGDAVDRDHLVLQLQRIGIYPTGQIIPLSALSLQQSGCHELPSLRAER